MTKQRELQEKLKQVHDLVTQCEQIAKEGDLSFGLDYVGTFYGSAKAYKDEHDYLDSEEDARDAFENDTYNGWWIPSKNC